MCKNWANEIDSYQKDFDAAGKTKAGITDRSNFRKKCLVDNWSEEKVEWTERV